MPQLDKIERPASRFDFFNSAKIELLLATSGL